MVHLKRYFIGLGACIVALGLPSIAIGQTTLSIAPSKDNTLYEDELGQLSNGAGPHFFVGATQSGAIHRGLIAFNLAPIPAGAIILSTSLTMRMDRTSGGATQVALHRLTKDWGEGLSMGIGEGGQGGQALVPDATWLHNIYDSSFWGSPGGDFSAVQSATLSVGGNNTYTWTGMQTDVQGWVDSPASNFGWIVIGDEVASGTSKRFRSRQGSVPPMLSIQYMIETLFADGFE